MVRPLKTTEAMKAFVLAGTLAQERIAQKFNLPWPMPDAVLEADSWVLTEMELPDKRQTHYSTYTEDEAEFLDYYQALTS